jgi:hypothetical protein
VDVELKKLWEESAAYPDIFWKYWGKVADPSSAAARKTGLLVTDYPFWCLCDSYTDE